MIFRLVHQIHRTPYTAKVAQREEKSVHHCKCWQGRLGSVVQHHGQGQPSFLLWSTQEDLMGEMDIWFFMFRNNDSAGLGNWNSGQRSSLWKVVNVSGGGNFVRGVCLLSPCVSAVIHSSALHAVKLGFGALQTILPFCQLDPFRCTHGGRRRHEGKGEGTSHSCMISLYFVSILWPLSQQ